MNRLLIGLPAVIGLVALALYLGHDRSPDVPAAPPARSAAPTSEAAPARRGPFTVEQRLAQLTPAVTLRAQPAFAAAGLAWPPRELAYLAFKDADTLEVHGHDGAGKPWRFVKRYPVLAASGRPGPKLAEGDGQVPEGIYQAQFLNANSRFHLSIRLNYPNDFDRRMAQRDGRTRLGGDIMIHGNMVSIGCLAMGDEAAEDLFILSALARGERTRIVVSPTDFRRGQVAATAGHAPWVKDLYASLRDELKQYRSGGAI